MVSFLDRLALNFNIQIQISVFEMIITPVVDSSSLALTILIAFPLALSEVRMMMFFNMQRSQSARILCIVLNIACHEIV